MKPVHTILASLTALSIAACDNAQVKTAPAETPMEMAEPDEKASAYDDAGIGHATGVIRSVGDRGDFLTIEHGPFAGDIAMGAMTMGFDITDGVDLSGFSDGDTVSFMVKRGRDGAIRITHICNTDMAGKDCLEHLMHH